MTKPKAILATTGKEIRRHAEAARGQSDRDIILAPVDFSDHSEAALIQAAAFAEMNAGDADRLARRARHPGEMPGYYSKLIKKKKVTRGFRTSRPKHLTRFMDRVIAENPGLECLRSADRLMVTGLPVTRILELVKYLDPIMVVMGSQGRTGLKHLVIGSKAAQIVQLCPCARDDRQEAGRRLTR